ncbi:Uncharacterised protein r2_g769 [Pycnogonum litorale]
MSVRKRNIDNIYPMSFQIGYTSDLNRLDVGQLISTRYRIPADRLRIGFQIGLLHQAVCCKIAIGPYVKNPNRADLKCWLDGQLQDRSKLNFSVKSFTTDQIKKYFKTIGSSKKKKK